MKPPFSLSAILLAFLLAGCVCLPSNVWSKTAPSPPGRAGKTQFSESSPSVTIPGPLRSFLRMAAISQEVPSKGVLPLLAHNIALDGYVGYVGKAKSLRRTEYLVLLKGYLEQARKLMMLAGPKGVIRISKCGEARPLLAILGYRLTQPCGPDTFLETADPKRAFLADDSGFPLANLEQTLREGKPFVYAFPRSQAPVLFSQSDWLATDKKHKKGDVIDALLRDPALARLYWGLDQMDANTRRYLRQSPGLKKLVPLAGVLDFYGSQICIRSGRVIVPGGAPAEPAWKNLVGVSPKSPGAFIVRLLTKDEGWMAAYFDALSRANSARQAYFTQPRRLRLFYEALRGKSVSPGPARPVFRPDPGLLLLATRLQLDSSGQPRIPGNLEVWKDIIAGERRSDFKVMRMWAAHAKDWENPDQLVACMFALSRIESGNNPLQIYLTLSEIDRQRPQGQRLAPQTVQLLAEDFPQFGDQYPIFSEFYALNDASIDRFLSIADAVDHIPDRVLCADTLGIFQANAGLWQILARQGEIPKANWNQAWQQVINPFAAISSPVQLFDAARISLRELALAASGTLPLSQEKIIALLAGPNPKSPEDEQVRREIALKIRSVLDAQRLVSLDTLFALGSGLNRMAAGKPAPRGLIPLAGELREFQMPKPLFTNGERAEWSYGLYSNVHIQSEMATDLTKIIKSLASRKELAAARGELVPFLRDTLVGLNYAYYAPPGAQMLYNNPLLVRSHDFLGDESTERDQAWKTPTVFGRGQAASGGAHLTGSLAGLPYVLAEVEENFIVPKNVQALIWEDLAPTLLANSVVPRWWRVTPNELHAVTLYQQFGEEILAASSENEQLRLKVMGILSGLMLASRAGEVDRAIREGRWEDALSSLTPAEIFSLAAEFRQRFPDETNIWGKAGQELDELSRRYPTEVSWKRLSEDFGAPHPALAQTYACELLNVKPFPTFLGYSSRLLAESWESNNLYWARLADESGYPPVMLNLLAPELTRQMVANIFATDLGDWPALIRALRQTGEEFRQGKLAFLPNRSTATSL
ncbi:MAG TPA: hypothetical protein VKV79_08055 [Terriglobia bacterium]|nr:hypothetical protein [Terriglobia bacterium]